jgi:hypothetical protein
MLFSNNPQPFDRGFPSSSEVKAEYCWSLWKTAQSPSSLLANGLEVVLVDSWPGGSRLTWLASMEDVLSEPYVTKKAAITRLSRHFSLRPSEVLSNPYTLAKADGPGHLIAWRASPVKKLNVPRPPDLKFRPNGWLQVEDHRVLRSWGLPGGQAPTRTPRGPRGGGQGRLDQASKKAVELRTLDVAADWCRSQGRTDIANVGAKKSWDLEARKPASRDCWFIEVKGTTGSQISVVVTEGEVKAAYRHGPRSVLIVIHNIELEVNSKGRPLAKGGMAKIYNPWGLLPEELKNTQYV